MGRRGPASQAAARRHTAGGMLKSSLSKARSKGASRHELAKLLSPGVRRNAKIPANANLAYHDLGLCGPLRTDLTNRPEYCGLFKTPTLRNVATRKVFFHNGLYHRLQNVLDFYAERCRRAKVLSTRSRRTDKEVRRSAGAVCGQRQR